MIGVVILAALMATIGTYIDKHLVNKGISRNDYFYYMCLSMIPFSIIMIVIEILTNNFKFEFSIIPIILLLLAMFVRYKKQHTLVGCLTHLNPYEVVTYMSLGIILAFIIDSILGIKQFNIIILLSIVLTLIGVFTLADVKLKIKSLQKDLIIRIVCEITMGYITHYILKYWSNASFIFILNLLLTIIFSKGYTLQYHKNNKNILKWVFIQQTFGFCSTYLGNYLSSNSVVLSSYTKPVSIVLTILVAFVIKNNEKKPKLLDVFAVFLVAIRYIIAKYNIILKLRIILS